MNVIAEGIQKSAEDVRENELEVAMQRLEDLTESNPYSVDLMINKSTLCYKLSNINEAVRILGKAIEVDPFDYRVYYNLFVIYWKQQKYSASYVNLKKCLSLIYTTLALNRKDNSWQRLLNRSLQLWDQNTASFVVKALNLINSNELAQASEVTSEALQKCIVKHHIYALCCLIDSKLNRQAERQRNAKDYHTHLLRPIIHADHYQEEGSSEEAKTRIIRLTNQFNQACRKCEVASYHRHESQPSLLFMSIKKPVSINLQYEISKNSGVLDLACIKQDKQESEIAEKQTPASQAIATMPENQEQSPQMTNAQQEHKYEIKDLELNNSKEDSKVEDLNYGEDNSRSLESGENELVSEQVKQNAKWNVESASLEQNLFKQQKPFQLGDLNAFPAWMGDQAQSQPDPTTTAQLSKVPTTQNEDQKKEQHKDSVEEELLYPITHPKFEVRLIMADLQINQQLVGKMDPYVYYEYGNQKHKTTIAKGQGLKPRWENEIKVFSLERNPTNMRVSVYDREVFRWDDLVGQGNFEVVKVGQHQLPIYLKGKKKGEVVFIIRKVE